MLLNTNDENANNYSLILTLIKQFLNPSSAVAAAAAASTTMIASPDNNTVLFVIDKETNIEEYFNHEWMHELKQKLKNDNIKKKDVRKVIFAFEKGIPSHHRRNLKCKITEHLFSKTNEIEMSYWNQLDDLMKEIGNYRFPFNKCVLTANVQTYLNSKSLYPQNMIYTKLINITENATILYAVLPQNPSLFGVSLFNVLALITILQTFQTVVNTNGTGSVMTDLDFGVFMLITNAL